MELGLRERKKAQMRQQISDVATRMFLDQGFDEVRVADIAAAVGISEKTVFNYFSTKESLVLDQTDAQLAGSVAALAGRGPHVSPTSAYVAELKSQLRVLTGDSLAGAQATIPRFGKMFEDAPTLRAAWGDHRHRLVLALADVLAADLGVDAGDPEPLTVARALASLTELSYDSVSRHVLSATSHQELFALVEADLDRGATLVAATVREVRRNWRGNRRQRPASSDANGPRTTGSHRMRGRGQA